MRRLCLRVSRTCWRLRYWLARRQKDNERARLRLHLALFTLAALDVCEPSLSATSGERSDALGRLRRVARQEF